MLLMIWNVRDETHSWIREMTELMVPYEHLSEDEKGKDRRAVLIACRLFNQLRLDVTFKTSPIHFTELVRE